MNSKRCCDIDCDEQSLSFKNFLQLFTSAGICFIHFTLNKNQIEFESFKLLEFISEKENSSTLTVVGVKRRKHDSYVTFSCNGGSVAGGQIFKTVSVIGSLQVIN